MRPMLLAALAIGLGLAAATLHAQPLGRASVSDGDSLEIAGQRVRLHGIDAPEWKQQCTADGRQWRCGRVATVADHGLRDRG